MPVLIKAPEIEACYICAKIPNLYYDTETGLYFVSCDAAIHQKLMNTRHKSCPVALKAIDFWNQTMQVLKKEGVMQILGQRIQSDINETIT